jgi:hypothetical protein
MGREKCGELHRIVKNSNFQIPNSNFKELEGSIEEILGKGKVVKEKITPFGVMRKERKAESTGLGRGNPAGLDSLVDALQTAEGRGGVAIDLGRG